MAAVNAKDVEARVFCDVHGDIGGLIGNNLASTPNVLQFSFPGNETVMFCTRCILDLFTYKLTPVKIIRNS